MKRVLQRQEPILALVSVAVVPPRISPRELETPFDGFGAAIRKERAIQTGKLAQLFSQAALILVIEEVRNVKRPLDLLPQELLHPRIVVSQRIDADSGQQI